MCWGRTIFKSTGTYLICVTEWCKTNFDERGRSQFGQTENSFKSPCIFTSYMLFRVHFRFFTFHSLYDDTTKQGRIYIERVNYFQSQGFNNYFLINTQIIFRFGKFQKKPMLFKYPPPYKYERIPCLSSRFR